MPRRVFISYSSRDPSALALMEHLATDLGAAGHEVLVDRKRIQPGEQWRDEIFAWLGLCHAAVVLLSPTVFDPQSVWVPREASILSWRKTLKDDFLLLPVFVGGATIQDLLDDRQFSALAFEDLQAIQHSDPASTTAAIRSQIEQISTAHSPVDVLADQMCAQLQHVSEAGIAAASRELNFDLGPVHPFQDERRALALALLQVSLRESSPALEQIAAYCANPTVIRRIIDIIAPSWVDLCAARWIRALAGKQRPPAMLLNANLAFAAEMYVRRASGLPPNVGSRVVRITALHGERDTDDLAAEVEEALLMSFSSSLLDEDDQDRQLRSLLRNLRNAGKPAVVVIAELPARAREVAATLQERFADVCFLYLTGAELPDAVQCPAGLFRPLLPALRPGEDQHAADDFVLARTLIPTSDGTP